jgi:hypothetical protein
MENIQLQAIITAKDEASKVMEGFKNNIEKHSKSIGIGMAAAGGVIAGGMGMSVKAYMDSERATARLAHLTKQTSNATDEQIEGLNQQAKALQKVGVVEDDTVTMGQSQLATFALNTEQIKKLTPSLMDMAVASKGVNATQDDMINIGNALGRAVDGGTGALTRYGISLTDAQKELYKTASREERVSLLSEILQDNFGGLNEATRKTSEGGIAALKNDFGDLMENIGGQLIPIMKQLMDTFKPILEKIMAWVTENPKLFNTIILIIAAIGGLLLALSPIIMFLPQLIVFVKMVGTAFMFLTSTTGLVILAIIALIAIGYLLWKNWEEIKNYFLKIWEKIKIIFFETIDLINEKINNIFTEITDFLKTKWEEIKNCFQFAIDFIQGLFIRLFDWLLPTWREDWQIIAKFLAETWEGIKDNCEIVLSFIRDIFNNVWNSIKKTMVEVWNWLVETITKTTAPLLEVWNVFWNNILKTITKVWDSIYDKIMSVWNSVKGIIDKISGFTGGIIERAKGIGGGAIEWVKETAKIGGYKFAKGGIVTKPTLGLVGEAGAEAIIPLKKGNPAFLPTINLYISNNKFIGEEEEAEKLGDAIIKNLKLNLKFGW